MAFSDLDLTEAALLEQGMANIRVQAIKVQKNLDNIQSVLEKRASGELAEPILNLDVLTPLVGDNPHIQKSLDDFKEFVEDKVILPFRENKAVFDKLSVETQLLVDEKTTLFDLTYGPPISVKGQFIMSEDGLYYDSINGGVPTVSGIVAASSTWNLSQAPNLGGKGIAYTQEHLDDLVDTIFSYKYDPSSTASKPYYDSDDVLESFYKNKAQHIDLLFKHIDDLEEQGYSASGAIVVNYYSNLGALADMYDNKIKRRKKLLQLVSIFGTYKYSFSESAGNSNNNPKNLGLGDGVLIENIGSTKEPEWVKIERIPLNDFTFLKGSGLNINLKKQEKLLIFSEDLEDVIAPVHVKFTRGPAQSLTNIDKFSIPPTPRDSFPHIQGDTNVSSTGGFVQSLTTSIILDGMLLGYNFLTPSVVDPSSQVFNIDNFNTDTKDVYNGQLVGTSVADVYTSGLSIPKLTGTGPGGSYVRLPSNYTPSGGDIGLYTRGLNDLFYPENRDYNPDTKMGGGVSFDFWVHVPDLTFTNEHRYRLVAACENSGAKTYNGSLTAAQNASRTFPNGNPDTTKVHGMVMGFRDRGGAIATTSGLEFGVFPTVSQNRLDGTTGHSVCIAEHFPHVGGYVDASAIRDLGLITPASVLNNSVKIGNTANEFMHVAVVFDFSGNRVSTLFDGEVLSTDALDVAFGTDNVKALLIPSVTHAPNPNYLGTSSWENTTLTGPVVGNLGQGFTPWILGGGFTDGIAKYGSISTYDPGFLGYNTNQHYGSPPNNSQHSPSLGGITSTKPSSGLGGFLGSFKLYSRALSIEEVRHNFNSQKGFFKNIKL